MLKTLNEILGEKWHDMRLTLSPNFTTSKIKMMFTLIDECAVNLTTYFGNIVNPCSVLEIDVKDVMKRFTNDTIATTSFGIKCDSITDRDNQFYVKSRKAMVFDGSWNILKFLIMGWCPKLAKVSLVLNIIY